MLITIMPADWLCLMFRSNFIDFDGLSPRQQAPGGGGKKGPRISPFLSPFTHRCYMSNLLVVEIGLVVEGMKIKMFKSIHPTNDNGQKKIAISHLSDSVDLQILIKKSKWHHYSDKEVDCLPIGWSYGRVLVKRNWMRKSDEKSHRKFALNFI